MMTPKQKLLILSSTQSGFTLIECLIAILIVGVLMVAVAPALVVASATRVQARRVELATQAAQTYIDGLRAQKIPPPPYGIVMNLNQQTNTGSQTLKDFTAPKGGSWPLDCPNPPSISDIPTVENVDKFYCKDANGYAYLYCVDLDSKPNNADCTKGDYIVQGFRSFSDLNDKGELGYMLGLRVYRADAMTFNGTLQTTVGRGNKKVAAYTGGAGDRTAPLVEMTTAIRTDKTTYETLKKRLGVKSDPPPSGSSSSSTSP
jgi:prepilin-type N-terminal cleavage/methylation domain-containing protein